MLADTDDVEPDLLGQDRLLEEFVEPAVGVEHAALGRDGGGDEGVEAELHGGRIRVWRRGFGVAIFRP